MEFASPYENIHLHVCLSTCMLMRTCVPKRAEGASAICVLSICGCAGLFCRQVLFFDAGRKNLPFRLHNAPLPLAPYLTLLTPTAAAISRRAEDVSKEHRRLGKYQWWSSTAVFADVAGGALTAMDGV